MQVREDDGKLAGARSRASEMTSEARRGATAGQGAAFGEDHEVRGTLGSEGCEDNGEGSAGFEGAIPAGFERKPDSGTKE